MLLLLAFALLTDISGVVVDQSRAVVAGARVTLERPAGSSLTSTTDLTGTFRFTDLPSGSYRLQIEQPGFKPASRSVRLGSSPARVRITLEIAELRQQVTVGNPDAKVSTDSAENQDIIKLDRKALDKLPMLGNDVIGAASQFLDQGAIGASGVSVVVDGMETSKIGVSKSAIQEVRINSNPYAAEFSRPGRGRIEIITKPAEDAFHGSAEFVFRDSIFDARNAFAETRPNEQRRIFEGHLTGPLFSKKTAFLLSVNHEEEDLQNLVYAYTPSGTVNQNYPNPKRQTEASFKVSHRFGDRHDLSLRYEFGDDRATGEGVGGFVLPEAGVSYIDREHNAWINYNALVNPRITNAFTMRITRQSIPTRSETSGVRQIVVQDAFTGGGAQADRHETQNRVQFTDILSWVHGKHLLKAGIGVPGFYRRGLNDLSNYDGTYSFSSLSLYSLGQPYLFQVQRGDTRLVYWQKELGLFVQDDFRVRPNLSVSVGLRYDWQNYLADHNNFAPRLSIAFSPDKKRKLVFRAGAGIFYEKTGASPIADMLRFDGVRLRQYVLSDPSYPDPLAGGGNPAATPSSVTRFASNLRSPYLLQYSGGAERQLNKSLTLTAAYTGLTGISMFRSLDLNAPPPPFYLARPDASVGVLRTIESAGRLQSHSVDLGVRGSIGEVFKGMVQYGIGRAYNNTGGIGWFPANSYDLSGEWARANFDQRHRFRTTGTFKAGEIFELGTILSLNTGAPYTITTGRDDNHDGRASDRPTGIARNTRQGFGSANLDVKLSHEFKLTRSDKDEAPSFDAGIEAFNVLNRVNYTTVIGNLSSPFFGQPVASKAARRIELRVEFKF